MKRVIISLHGFNSGPGQKAQELQKQFPNCEVIAPQLPYDPKQAIKLIRGIIDQHDHDDVHIVGTSLGAFYIMYLSTFYVTRDNLTYYLINTSFEPHKTLRRYEGKVLSNFKTQEQFETNAQFFHTLSVFFLIIQGHYDSDCIHASNYFIGTDDEVIDFTNFMDFIKSKNVPYRVFYSQQGHRYTDLTQVVNVIKENMVP